MKNQWKKLQLGLLLFALPMVATAAVSANQWMNREAPIKLGLDQVEVDSSIGLARVHKVGLSVNGVVEGRIAALDTESSQGIADLTVYFLSGGKIAAETKTKSDGSFSVVGLQEGAYSFVATGENGFAAYGVHVVADASIENVMEAAAVAPNLAGVKQILTETLPEKVATEIVSNTINAAPSGANRVKLVDGKLVGNVFALLGGQEATSGTTVHILKDENQVAKVETDEAGSFMIADLEPGVYGFVAAGPTGFAAISFEAVQESGDVEMPVSVEETLVEPVATTTQPITYQDSMPVDIPVDVDYADSLDVCLTCTQDVGFVDSGMSYDPGYVTEFAPVEYAAENISYGGACGAACGSCGNFAGFQSSGCCGGGPLRGGIGGGRLLGGGGGLGRLALLGGLAGGIVAIASDGDAGAASPTNPN